MKLEYLEVTGELRRRVVLCKQAPGFPVNVECELLERALELLERQDDQIKAMNRKLMHCMDNMDERALQKVFVQPLFGSRDEDETP